MKNSAFVMEEFRKAISLDQDYHVAALFLRDGNANAVFADDQDLAGQLEYYIQSGDAPIGLVALKEERSPSGESLLRFGRRLFDEQDQAAEEAMLRFIMEAAQDAGARPLCGGA